MPRIAALLHTHNDALRLGRCLETLFPCDEVLIIDHGSRDSTLYTAREYGARVVEVTTGASVDSYLRLARDTWILCLDTHESLTENLAASLYEWKSESPDKASSFSMFMREETTEGWIEHPEALTRLVPSTWNRWERGLPVADETAVALEGELLRFVFP